MGEVANAVSDGPNFQVTIRPKGSARPLWEFLQILPSPHFSGVQGLRGHALCPCMSALRIAIVGRVLIRSRCEGASWRASGAIAAAADRPSARRSNHIRAQEEQGEQPALLYPGLGRKTVPGLLSSVMWDIGAPEPMPDQREQRNKGVVSRRWGWSRLTAMSMGGLCALWPLPVAHGYLAGSAHVGIPLQSRGAMVAPRLRPDCPFHTSFAGSLRASEMHWPVGALGVGAKSGRVDRRHGLHGRRLSMSQGGTDEPLLTVAEIEAMTVPQMKKALKTRGLSPTGKAQELVERLIEACTAEGSGGAGGDGEHQVVFKNKSGGGASRKVNTVGPMSPPELDVIDVEEMATVGELQAALRQRGMSEDGTFDELQLRLMERVIEEEEAYELAMDGEFKKAQLALADAGGEGEGRREPPSSAPLSAAAASSRMVVTPAGGAGGGGVSLLAGDEGVASGGGEWMGGEELEGGGVWAYVEVEDVAEMAAGDVREALAERGMAVEGSDEEARERLVLAILAEDAEEDSGLEGDAAWEDLFNEKWGGGGGIFDDVGGGGGGGGGFVWV